MSAQVATPSVSQLGYLVFEVSNLEAWRGFADMLGLGMTQPAEDQLELRLDGHATRLFVRQGAADDLVAVGWEAASESDLEAIVARLRERAVDVTKATQEEARSRRVRRLFRLLDPYGIPTELACGAELSAAPFQSARVSSGFVADALGLGHVVLACDDIHVSAVFYRELLGFRLSDRIRCNLQGYAVDVLFYHCNPRHHSLALGGPHKKRLHHFMLEVRDLDDVGKCFDRVLRSGVRVQQTIGRHPNDRMVSFYAKTPSGFQLELGCGARLVDDNTWEPTEYDRVSDWGHTPPKLLAGTHSRAGQVTRD